MMARPSKLAKAFLSVHVGPPSACADGQEGTAVTQPRSIAIVAKGEVEMGIFTKDIKTMEDLLIYGLLDISRSIAAADVPGPLQV